MHLRSDSTEFAKAVPIGFLGIVGKTIFKNPPLGSSSVLVCKIRDKGPYKVCSIDDLG